MKPFSLVLSGGAARGFYHFGVLQALREHGLKPSQIVGCSAGALIGAIAASAWEREYLALAKDLRVERLLIPDPFTTGVFDTRRLERALHDLIPAREFEKLAIPLRVNATDANTGDEIILSKGDLFTPLLASMAVPAVFPVQEHDGRVLMDGGVVDNLPVCHARHARIIASDVTFPLGKITTRSSKAEILRNTALISIHHNRTRSLAAVRHKNMVLLYLNDPLFGADLRHAKLVTIAQRGYDDTKRSMRAIEKLLR